MRYVNKLSLGDRARQTLCVLIAGSFLFQQSVQAAGPRAALPTGGTYTAGNGSIHTSGNAMTIIQSSSKGVIDWTAFSIGAANRVNFLNGSGATLNRVTSDQMSSLLGTLRSSGTVYLINPNGILIGPKGKINTGGDFVASTLNLSNATFLNGGALLFQGGSASVIKNVGMISSNGGSILLIANNVQNAGSVVAPNGTAGLAAGQQVLFKNSADDQRVFVQAPGGDITNSGSISAAQAEIRSNGGNIYAIAGNNNTGIIRATGTATKDGHVWLIAENGTANVGGTISAQNANGTGGDVETSGEHLTMSGANVSTGKSGNWLLDPVDLTIDSSAASSIDSALSSSNVTVSTSASGSSGFGTVNPSGSGDIDVTSGIAWNSANSLTLSAYRNINVTAGITNGGSGNLTLQADNAATESGTIAFSGSGGVAFATSGNVNVYYHPSGYPTATSYASNIAMGSGALTAYMTVDSMTDLQHVNNNLSGTYALNTNLDATGVSFTQIADGSTNYNPSSGFSGLFDGQGHTISNLTPNTSTSDENAGGLFNQISSGGTVRNLAL